MLVTNVPSELCKSRRTRNDGWKVGGSPGHFIGAEATNDVDPRSIESPHQLNFIDVVAVPVASIHINIAANLATLR